MNGAWLHLGGVHLPIALAVVAVLLVLLALVTKSAPRLKFALEMTVLGAALSWGALLTGEEAEEIVEKQPGISDPDLHYYIHEHEDWAERAHYTFQAAGAIALIGWFFCRKAEKFRMPLAVVALVATGATAGLMGYTGHMGGQIRHIEVRDAPSAIDGTSPTPSRPVESEGEADDDH